MFGRKRIKDLEYKVFELEHKFRMEQIELSFYKRANNRLDRQFEALLKYLKLEVAAPKAQDPFVVFSSDTNKNPTCNQSVSS